MKRYPSTLIHYDNKVIEVDASRVLVAFKESTSREQAAAIAKQFRLKLEDEDQQEASPPAEMINHTDRRYWLRSMSDRAISDAVSAKLEAYRPVAWIAPVYWPAWSQRHQGRFSPLPQVLLVRFRPNISEALIRRIERRHRLKFNEAKSRYLGELRFYNVNSRATTAYAVRDELEQESSVARVSFTSMPMHSPLAFTPTDEHFPEQWNLHRIGAEAGWDLTRGSASVKIGVLDRGCNMDHEDLRDGFDGPGFNAETLEPDGSGSEFWHGTSVTGIAAARINNDGEDGTTLGVAGIAGACTIHAVAIPNHTDDEVIAAINEAVDEAGVSVINMSFRDSDNSWNRPEVDEAIDHAHVNGVVLCAAAGNLDAFAAWPAYPGTNDLVISVGAINSDDERAEYDDWESYYGPFLDVVAPGVDCWTTTGSGGYIGTFNMTSAATPHVAGLAALLRSQYPGLSNVQVRNIIEQSCEKVNPARYSYVIDDDHPNGAWNEEMGYGLINIDRALHYADAYIRDYSADDGSVPVDEEERFWDSPDIGIRYDDNGIFGHDGPARIGNTNYVYVRVTNLGPYEAQNVRVRCLAVPFVSTEFVYDDDWPDDEDELHLFPTDIEATFTTISTDPGSNTVIARFSFSAEQIDQLHGWQDEGWHPCILAEVRADNDYNNAAEGQNVWHSNNLAQKNISVYFVGELRRLYFPFLSGHPQNLEPYFDLIIDRHSLPWNVELYLDPDDVKVYFPSVDLMPPTPATAANITFLDRTRIAIAACDCEGILTLEAGSTFRCGEGRAEQLTLQGAEYVMHAGKRLIAIRQNRAIVRVPKRPGERKQFVLKFRASGDLGLEREYRVDVAQRNINRRIVGGVTVVARVGG